MGKVRGGQIDCRSLINFCEGPENYEEVVVDGISKNCDICSFKQCRHHQKLNSGTEGRYAVAQEFE